jgi:hypothetical protein
VHARHALAQHEGVLRPDRDDETGHHQPALDECHSSAHPAILGKAAYFKK